MKKKFQITAIIGFVAKGVIYVVIGLLSLLAAINMGGESSGTNQAFKFLKKQAFGQILLASLGLGLLCYSYWMAIQAFKDPEHRGSDRNGLAQRFGLFSTGLVYVFIALLAFYHLFAYSADDNDASNYLDILGSDLVSYIFIATGIILAIQGVILIVGVFRGQLLDQFNLGEGKAAKIIRFIGKFGFYARAFVVVIIAYFFLQAGIYTGNHEIKGIQDAFSFLDQSFLGSVLMAFTALGFIAYGGFYILLCKYRGFKDQ